MKLSFTAVYINHISSFNTSLRRIIFTILFFTLVAPAFAIKSYQPFIGDPLIESWRWQSFSELSGLDVRCMTEDAKGNMWFGINGGIIKYDGYKWTKYDSKNGFFNIIVEKLITTKDKKSIYAASKSGLFVLSNNKWKQIFPFKSSVNKNLTQVNNLCELHDGSILAGIGKAQSEYSGLLLIKRNKQMLYCSASTKAIYNKEFKGKTIKIIPDNFLVNNHLSFSSIYQDKDNRIWFTVFEPNFPGLIICSNSPSSKGDDLFNWNHVYTDKDGIVLGRHAIINQLNDGSIWIVNYESNKGILVFKNNKWKVIKLSSIIGYDEVHTSIIITPNSDLWIGGFGVLYVKEGSVWKSYKRPQLPIPNTRLLLYNDSKGNFWILGYRCEVLKVDNSYKRWKTYKQLNYQCQSTDNRKWFISVDDRVVVQNGNKWYSLGKEDGLPDAPTKVFITSKGTIWVTGSDKSIAATCYFDGKKWQKELHPSLSWSIDNRAVFEDSKHRIWFGCTTNIVKEKGQKGGVMFLEKPESTTHVWKYYPSTESLEFRNAYGIAESKDNTIWTGGTMLRSFKNGKWNGINDPDHANMIDIVKNNPNGLLWVGSRVLGLSSFDGHKWKNYNSYYYNNNGLISNSIIDILPKSDTDLWVATDKDFSHFDGKSWTNNVLPDELALIREAGSLVEGNDGCIWINSSSFEWKHRPLVLKPLNNEMKESFKTYCYHIDKQPPETQIVKCPKIVPYPGTMHASWSGKDAWNLTPESRLSFSYRLNGGEWSPFFERNSKTFIEVESGDNVLEVRARDLDFNIDPTPARAEFYVSPPVWEQLWFLALIAIFIIIIISYQRSLQKRNAKLFDTKIQLEHQNEEISNQKEKIIKIAQREQESNQLRIKFFTNISHEFRTPLTLILSSLERISSLDLETEKQAFSKYLLMMERNSQQMLRLINQLMEFRKADTNTLQLKATQGNIVKYAEGIVSSFQSLAEAHKINLIFEKNRNEILAWYDVDKIEKILYNLISNAIKFTSENGTIKVSVKLNKSEGSYQIQVQDTGIGIPQDEIDKILEPFYQAKNTPIRNEAGTGIGLSLVNSLVKIHHGTLRISSVVTNKAQSANEDVFNTSFTIDLPLGTEYFDKDEIISEEIDLEKFADDENTLPEIDSQEDATKDFAKKKILVIDDNPDIRELIIDTLSPDYEFIEAENGLDGFEKALDFQPDIIISDVMMPIMNGIDCCEKIKTDERTSHIPVILLTADDAEEQMIRGYETGADEYITKPFNARILVLRVKNIVDSRAKLRHKFRNEISLEPKSIAITSTDAQFIEKVLKVVDKNIKEENFDIEALSKELNVSVRQLHNKLTALTDMSPGEFIRIYKLKRAAETLLKKHATISEIAYEFGFSNPKYFSKCFRQLFGMTPTEYMNKNS